MPRDLGTHLLDLAALLTGAPLVVKHGTRSSHRTHDDEVRVVLRAGEVIMALRTGYVGAPVFRLAARGSRGTLVADLWSMTTPAQSAPGRLWSSITTRLPGSRRPAEGLLRSRLAMLAAVAPSPAALTGATGPNAMRPASMADAVTVLHLVELIERATA